MFHSICFKVAIMMDDFYPLPPTPPPKKLRIGKWRILASLQASAIFIVISRWGLGVFHLLQDCRPDLEIAAQCE